MTKQIENMESKVTEILDDMLHQKPRYSSNNGIHDQIKSKLGFELERGGLYLDKVEENEMKNFIDKMLFSPQYKTLLDTKALKESITTKNNHLDIYTIFHI